MVDTKIYIISYKLCSFELSHVICEDPLGHAEPVYDTLQELDYYLLCDIRYYHCLHPLGEGVNGNE
jgi:hypothetical protein